MTDAPPADTFRMSFWRIYTAAAVYAQLLFAPGLWAVIYWQATAARVPCPTDWQVGLYVIGSLAVAVVLAPAFFAYVRSLPVKVSADGFTCGNGFGKLVTVPWESITRVKPLILPGFPYLMVWTTKTKLRLWLPLFLRDLPEFTEKVEANAGGGHVLYQNLWPRVEEK
jgi:hypothetical protein